VGLYFSSPPTQPPDILEFLVLHISGRGKERKMTESSKFLLMAHFFAFLTEKVTQTLSENIIYVPPLSESLPRYILSSTTSVQ
jgi:hypothetical protein